MYNPAFWLLAYVMIGCILSTIYDGEDGDVELLITLFWFPLFWVFISHWLARQLKSMLREQKQKQYHRNKGT